MNCKWIQSADPLRLCEAGDDRGGLGMTGGIEEEVGVKN